MNDVFEKSKITEYQKLICQLEGVLSVQFVTNASGELEELHVLANKERNPKQLVRDIQSAMYAQYNLDVDYKVISIAQIDQDSIKSLCRNTRFVFDNTTVLFSNNDYTATVVLEADGVKYEGCCTGNNQGPSKNLIIAQATLGAINKYFKKENVFSVFEVRQIEVANKEAALVGVYFHSNDHSELLLGTAINKIDINVAVAKAVLDAVNRKISRD